MRKAPISSRQARDYIRLFLSGASDEVPDKQGRVTIPAALRSYAGLGQGAGSDRRGYTRRDLGRRAWNDYLLEQETAFSETDEDVLPGSSDPVPATTRGTDVVLDEISSRPAGSSWLTFPGARQGHAGPEGDLVQASALKRASRAPQREGRPQEKQPDEQRRGQQGSATCPVLRTAASSCCAPASNVHRSTRPRRRRRRHPRHGRTLRGAARALPASSTSSASTATQQALALAGERLAPFAEPAPTGPRCLRRDRRRARRPGLRAARRHPVRPRRLLAAAGRAPTAASPTPRTLRWTCGWTPPRAPTAADVVDSTPRRTSSASSGR